MELSEVSAGCSDEAIADADVLLAIILSQCPFYTH